MPDFLKRLRERRHLRARRHDRDELLLELGALVFELHRQGRRAPELLLARAGELEVVDQEVRTLEGLAGPVAPETEDWDSGAQATGEWDESEPDWDETQEWQALDESGSDGEAPVADQPTADLTSESPGGSEDSDEGQPEPVQ